MTNINIAHALADRNLLGAALGDDVGSWRVWFAVLRAAFALPLTATDREMFVRVAGDRALPTKRVDEVWCVCGRRSGKTRMAAAISVYIAAIERHKLASGEVGHVLLLASSKDQAAVAFRYVMGFLESSPLLRQQIVRASVSEVELRGNIIIGTHASSYRTIRGRTLLAVVADETSMWRSEESAVPDLEIYRACVPALTAARGLWVAISTGYRKVGLLYDKWRTHYGQSDDAVLVVSGDSRTFNPTLDAAMIARATAADPEAAISEWEGGFRSDLSTFLSDALIEDAVQHARPLELPPRRGQFSYRAFVDPSGGRHDAFTLCIGHQEGTNRYVVDALRGVAPPFDPQNVVKEFSTALKHYSIGNVVGDSYSAEWAAQAFATNGITYTRSELSKSELYLEALPLFARGSVAIPNHSKLIRELRLLERATHRSGRDTIDHVRGGSDDYANALCGMLSALSSLRYDESLAWVCSDAELGKLPWWHHQPALRGRFWR